jgi:predicted DNA-binding transcriptional regulator AlpA
VCLDDDFRVRAHFVGAVPSYGVAGIVTVAKGVLESLVDHINALDRKLDLVLCLLEARQPPTRRRVLKTPEAAAYVGLEPSTLTKLRCVGGGPKFVRLGSRAIAYDIKDLDAFIEEGRRSSTS